MLLRRIDSDSQPVAYVPSTMSKVKSMRVHVQVEACIYCIPPKHGGHKTDYPILTTTQTWSICKVTWRKHALYQTTDILSLLWNDLHLHHVGWIYDERTHFGVMADIRLFDLFITCQSCLPSTLTAFRGTFVVMIHSFYFLFFIFIFIFFGTFGFFSCFTWDSLGYAN
jgi:hypothetical protein